MTGVICLENLYFVFHRQINFLRVGLKKDKLRETFPNIPIVSEYLSEDLAEQPLD